MRSWLMVSLAALVMFSWAPPAPGTPGAGPTAPSQAVTRKAIDHDERFADRTEVLPLSGRGVDDAVPWEFMVSSGRRAGEWSTIPVPSNWELHGFGTFQYGSQPATDEVGTYRRTFEVPTAWSGKRVFIVFEGAMTDTRVLVNGRQAGLVHQGGFYRFRHDITPLLRPGSNHLEVVVSEQSANPSVNAAEREADYWTFGGIFRPVYLEAYPRPSIERFAVDARADGGLRVDVFLRDLSTDGILTARVLDEDLDPVGQPITQAVASGTRQATLSGSIPGARPWSAESPRRHRLAVELRTSAGRHAVRENFGFRTVEVRPGDGIYVNGRRVRLRGVNRHSFWPDSGRALSEATTGADVELIKDMNMNAVRNSHYPADRHFLDHADRAGLYVLDELAGWQAPPYDTEVGRRLVEEMVTFNVNHPSILFWDNGNEGGWNTELDGEFARWDPQRRPVLHPWETFSALNTDHYEGYQSAGKILAGETLFMPTEFLHGLYDGGGGAGIEDYWDLIFRSPRGAGGFLWALVDEGVRRSPTEIDTAGNRAPDGVVGPNREKEGSFYTIRDVWCPVQVAWRDLPADFDGRIEVENRYHETDLETTRFDWALLRFDLGRTGGGHTVVRRGRARTGSITPGAKGTLDLGRAAAVRADALRLDAYDRTGRHVGRWSWMRARPSQLRARIVTAPRRATAVAARDRGQTLEVVSADVTYTFSKEDGRLVGVSAGGQSFAFGNGPSLSAGSATPRRVEGAQEGPDYVLTATYDGDLQQVVWRVLAGGWLRLDYRYSVPAGQDFFGVDFDCAEERVEAVEWLGRGPHRVWKNRMRGGWHDVFLRRKNDAVTGARWDYPEFKGYFADVSWARILTADGPIEVAVDGPGLFLRLFTPKNGPEPRHAVMTFPRRDVSFLHGIAPIGDKFLPAAELGPQGQKHPAGGPFEGRLYFRFGVRIAAR